MDRKARFSLATNYALYYGHERAAELAHYDIAVLEPAGQSVNSLQEIKASGTLVVAYLSVMEVPVWSKVLDLLQASDFLQVQGKPYINPEYGNYWVNLDSQRWTDLLLQRVKDLMEGEGYDGVFLDTIGYVESRQLSTASRTSLLQAATEIVIKIRTMFPDSIIIQNCGLEELYRLTASYIDGICWENPPFNRIDSQEWAGQVIRNLEAVKETYGLQVLLLVEENNSCAREFELVQEVAKDKKFLLYYAPSFYTAGVTQKDSV